MRIFKKPNFSAFQAARKKYSEAEILFLTKSRLNLQQKRPYEGIKILHNTPLTSAAILKIEVLALGGADLTVTWLSTIPPQEEAIKILADANIWVMNQEDISQTFDIHLDCCGELMKLTPPTLGAVELTQTGSELYKTAALNYPIISVDDSMLKHLETFYGTGDGFIRALYQHLTTSIDNKKFIVFGFGKVGRGIVHFLKKLTNNIVVIDPHSFSSDKTIKFINNNDYREILKEIRDAFCVVTASGIQNLITDYYQFTKHDLGDAILTNMGAEDEYGQNFQQKDVLFDKRPLNFMLEEPTILRYLDPIFYAHNLGVDLLLSKKFNPGYHPFPDELSSEILEEWKEFYNEDIEDEEF